MKYYSEDETKEIRLALEAEILKWYKVDFKKMFGQLKRQLSCFLHPSSC
jgi:hypothetical protein